jgi:hypothetical protein
MLTARTFHSVLFALALLFAQQGAALHTLRHIFSEQTQKQNKQAPHSSDCEQCTTYAQLGSALNNSFLSFDFGTSLVQVFAQNYLILLTRHNITPSARGPPSLPSSI